MLFMTVYGNTDWHLWIPNKNGFNMYERNNGRFKWLGTTTSLQGLIIDYKFPLPNFKPKDSYTEEEIVAIIPVELFL